MSIKRVSEALAFALAAVCLASVSVLAAGNPDRQLIPHVPDEYVQCPSGIVALVQNTIENEYIKTFSQQDGTLRYEINGHLVVQVSGNGKTLTINASGPGTIIVRGGMTTIALQGRTLSIPMAANAIRLYTGLVVFDPVTGTVVSHNGTVTDVCALLN
jgi:hypothetical protein